MALIVFFGIGAAMGQRFNIFAVFMASLAISALGAIVAALGEAFWLNVFWAVVALQLGYFGGLLSSKLRVRLGYPSFR